MLGHPVQLPAKLIGILPKSFVHRNHEHLRTRATLGYTPQADRNLVEP
jgi:hypothetical protein